MSRAQSEGALLPEAQGDSDLTDLWLSTCELLHQSLLSTLFVVARCAGRSSYAPAARLALLCDNGRAAAHRPADARLRSGPHNHLLAGSLLHSLCFFTILVIKTQCLLYSRGTGKC